MCSGLRVAGLFLAPDADRPPFWDDVVESTLQARRYARMLASGHVAISDDGGDYTYYLDTEHCDPDGECRVVALGPGVHDSVIGDNFLDFLFRSFNEQILF